MTAEEKNIENLAEFLYLTEEQIKWEATGIPRTLTFNQLQDITKKYWRILAKVAIDFTDTKRVEVNNAFNYAFGHY